MMKRNVVAALEKYWFLLISKASATQNYRRYIKNTHTKPHKQPIPPPLSIWSLTPEEFPLVLKLPSPL